jgi:serine/threonine-protein kinase
MTSADRWLAVSPYLDQALSMADEARASWLAALRASAPQVAADLEQLLREHRELDAEGFLAGAEAAPRGSMAAGETVGSYTLAAPIGRGGMGTVWLAARSDGRFERRAAVKFLDVALGGSGESRFTREGRILARLTHPHIASLIDAGVTAGGQPYLVLEYVDGTHIDRDCDARALPIDARVRLFLDVLAAVAHAHANLIVHRDIKPSNVLVAADGTVKLLDFGIAKLLHDETAAPALATREGAVPLTPEFAAPEQFTGEPVSIAADIYSLGVLLYVLLTGHHPAGAHTRSPVELMKAIVETDPARPSEAVSRTRTARATLDAHARSRGTTRQKLRRALRGDLDTIVSKALKKEPGARYASVTAFADDLTRYLNHEPIRARADSAAYRAAKFVRRNRLPVAAAALVFVALGAGLYLVNRERTVAQRRFVEVRQLANKLFDIDAQVRQLPGSSKVRQMLVDTSLDYLRRLAPDAGGDLDLELEMGTAYMRVARVQGVPISANLGQSDAAEVNLQAADRLIATVLAAQPSNRTAILRAAQIAHDRMIVARLRGADAAAAGFAETADRRLRQYQETGPIAHEEAEQVVIASMNVANRFINDGRLERGTAMARRTVDIANATGQPQQAGAASMVVSVGLRDQGDLEGARAAVADAVRLLEKAVAAEAAVGRRIVLSLALIREGQLLGDPGDINMGRPDEAIAPLERAFGIADAIAAQDPADFISRQRVSIAGLTLASILLDRDPARSAALCDGVLRRLAAIANNRNVTRLEIDALIQSTYPLERLGRLDEARHRLDDAFARLAQLKLFPAAHVAVGSSAAEALRARASLEVRHGRTSEALAICRQLLEFSAADSLDPVNLLADATELSRLDTFVADVHRRAGDAAGADALDARRLELWRGWERKLPGNSFVLRQLQPTPAR